MSEYTSTGVSLVATPSNVEVITDLLTAALGSPRDWIPSSEIRRLRANLTGHSRHTAAASPATRVVLDRLQIDLSTLRPLSPNASTTTSPKLGDVRSLDAELERLEQVTVEAESVATYRLAVQALQDIGFMVRSDRQGDVAAIEGRRGHAVLLAELRGPSQIDLDWLGHGGDACEADMAEVQAALAARGFRLAVRRRVRHGAQTGGSLIARAARAGSGDLVAGVLASETEQSSRPKPSMQLDPISEPG